MITIKSLILFLLVNNLFVAYCRHLPESELKECELTSTCIKHMYPALRNSKSVYFLPKNPNEQSTEYWQEKARNFVEQQRNRNENTNVAKNLILFLGDGMGISTQAATRMYMGGEELELSFEKFPHTALSKTYCVDSQVADSACTSTSYLCGIKANKGTIGVNANVRRYNCSSGVQAAYQVQSIGHWAIKDGKDVGLVTTTRVTHASPAGLYAQTANRDWENDAEVQKDQCDPARIDDIAEQLINGEIGKKLKVIFGGGRTNFINNTDEDDEGNIGKRTDGKNLINEWKSLDGQRDYLWNKEQLLGVNPETTDHILGLFGSSHMEYYADVVANNHQNLYPTLAEMTGKAIEILSKSPNGFYLFVEGGRIDHGHHDNYARQALEETVQFSKAIELATQKLNPSDTLLVVTADHSHAFSYAGYAPRGNNILDVTDEKGEDGFPYMTLSYGNGPGYANNYNKTSQQRIDPTHFNFSSNIFRHPATVPLSLETHGGEDVGVYATGPWSHLFSGVMEQNMIPHMMAFAACIGNGAKACN